MYDYRGPEYEDTRVVMVVMKDLVNQDFDSVAAGLDALVQAAEQVPGAVTFPQPVSFPASPPGTNDGIDLGNLFGSGGSGGVLDDYPGLEFRSVPAYLYINGPARIFQNGNVSIDLAFIDSNNNSKGSPYAGAVDPVALPDLPPAPGPVEKTLSPKSGTVIELAGIFNGKPDGLKAQLDFTVGPVTINSLNELRDFAAQLRTPLSAHLVILLPFQFTVNKTTAPDGIPVFAGPSANPIGTDPAMELIPGGGDLLGRDSGDEDGTMADIMENLRSLSLEASVTNNLGINGYVKMLREMPGSANATTPELGRINLSGSSGLTIDKKDMETVPFSPALEIYLDGDFDIKRSLPPEGAMTMTMAVILRTSIDTTF
jgi:hypothetical protein